MGRVLARFLHEFIAVDQSSNSGFPARTSKYAFSPEAQPDEQYRREERESMLQVP
jgi:hypothetical protein